MVEDETAGQALDQGHQAPFECLQVRRADQVGNDEADKAADLGATTASQAKAHAFGGLYSKRHLEYKSFMQLVPFICHTYLIYIGSHARARTRAQSR